MSSSFDMPVANILTNPRQEWGRMASGRVRVARNIGVDWSRYTQDNYLFAHVSAVCSVATEADGHTIVPACQKLVNNNGNAWTNPVLLETFKSFIGGHVFQEHVQVEALSKGRILDAVLRPIVFEDDEGNKADIYWCDLLTATDRKHETLVGRVERGELTTLSMGTICPWVTCSKCGRVMGDDDTNCRHIEHEILKPYKTRYGKMSVVSELCGRVIKDGNGNLVGDPKSNRFIEISWVERPAFEGAVLNHYVGEIPKEAHKILAFNTERLQLAVDDLFHMRVADRRGMMVLRIAREELSKRMREDRISRIAGRLS